MKLIGKKLYRTGSLKLFKNGTTSEGSRTASKGRTSGSGGGMGFGEGKHYSDIMGYSRNPYSKGGKNRSGNRQFSGRPTGVSPLELERRKKAEEAAKERAEWKTEAKRFLYDPEQKKLYDKQVALAEGMGGELQKAGAERGLRTQMAVAGTGRGGAAQRMRGLTRAGETGVRDAAAMGAQAGQTQAKMYGDAGTARMAKMKSDKKGLLGYFQKSGGLDVASKASQDQAAATRAANSKASGGEIFKSYKRKNGPIKGPGTETSDSIKAKLSDGEFVVNSKTVRGIGESMGAKGKDQSRKVGSGFLYDLQTKYGDKKPVNKALGGLEMAELGSAVMSSGLLGKKLEAVGQVTDAGISAKKGLDKKKASDLDMKKGGDVNLGKGVKAKRKFREAIGWEADKIFEKKAEKAYKEGHTGYKNWKGDSVVKLGRGGFLGSLARTGIGAGLGFLTGGPMGAAVGGISAAGKEKKAEDQRKSNLAMGEAKAQQKVAQSGKQLASEDIELKKGGSVIDRPKLNVEKLLKEPLGREYRLPEHGDDIDSPSKKKLEPRSTKKPPPWMRKKEEPVKMEKGGDWRKEISDRVTKKYPKGVLTKKALRQRINKAIVSEKDFREGAEKSKSRWSPQRIKAMEDQAIEEEVKLRQKQAKSKERFKGVKDLGKTSRNRTFKDKLQDEKDRTKRGKPKAIAASHEVQRHFKKSKPKAIAESHEVQRHSKNLDKKKGEEDFTADLAKRAGMSVKDYKSEMAEEGGVEAKGRRETSSIMAKPKEEKSWWGKMPDSDKATVLMGAGKGVLSGIKGYHEAKDRRKKRTLEGLSKAHDMRAKAGQQLIAADVALRKGGRVSFKDVLKAKKKMGY